MTFTLLLAITGLTLSAVAIYYSVIGLTAIFSAAFWPIVVMGTSLEVSKLVAASWLKANWKRIPLLMKTYMMIAVFILMVITSMGIFGFLSKAHSDQNLVSGDVQSKIAVYDEKIKTAKENIDANRKALKQMDEAVDQVMGRSTDEKGADKAVALRKGQAKERTRLLSEITAEQKVIAQLSEERAPIAAEVRKVEAEVGPIKYIAAFIYGDNPDTNILEKAVTWVIITIIVVFDPLAVLMLLASQMNWQWRKEEPPIPSFLLKKENPDPIEKPFPHEILRQETTVTQASNEPQYEQNDGPLTEDQVNQIKTLTADEVTWPFPSSREKVEEVVEPVVEAEQPPANIDNVLGVEIDAWNKMVEAAEAEVAKEKEAQDKKARAEWKEEHPNDTLKRQETLYELGMIENLPWETVEKLDEQVANEIPDLERPGDYLTPPTEEEESKKKKYMIKDPEGHIQVKTVEDTSKTPNNPK